MNVDLFLVTTPTSVWSGTANDEYEINDNP